MIDDKLEFSICQYLDGDLSPAEREALERRLAEDSEARALLEQHRKLSSMLKTSWPMPEVQWDRLADQLSASIADEEQAARYRIGTWVRTATKLAIAAGILLAAGLSLRYFGNHDTVNPINNSTVAVVSGPQAQEAAGPSVAEVEIAPARQMASSKGAESYAVEDLVVSPPRIVMIAADQEMPDDMPGFLR